MLPKILKNFNVFVDGRGYAGKVEEVSLPKLSLKTDEFRAGGMDAPVEIDLGMEKLEADLTFAEYDSELIKLFGLTEGNEVALTLRGVIQSTGNADSVIINLRGIIKEMDFGSWKPADKATLKCSISCAYYKLSIADNNLVEIDAVNMIRKINGVDQLSSHRTILGI
ncbi:phage major tail tube protein [Alphaproteobacteria bacterium]|nr:phage major tail tube protein [Alphaproteobacteria bacterium]